MNPIEVHSKLVDHAEKENRVPAGNPGAGRFAKGGTSGPKGGGSKPSKPAKSIGWHVFLLVHGKVSGRLTPVPLPHDVAEKIAARERKDGRHVVVREHAGQ